MEPKHRQEIDIGTIFLQHFNYFYLLTFLVKSNKMIKVFFALIFCSIYFLTCSFWGLAESKFINYQETKNSHQKIDVSWSEQLLYYPIDDLDLWLKGFARSPSRDRRNSWACLVQFLECVWNNEGWKLDNRLESTKFKSRNTCTLSTSKKIHI